MATSGFETELSSDELLKAVGHLNLADLDRFVAQVIQLRAQRNAHGLPGTEADLPLRINQGIPAEIREQYDRLKDKRRAETLTPEEHGELLSLTAQVEDLQAARAECLAELARIRKTTLTALMEDLGIRMPEHV